MDFFRNLSSATSETRRALDIFGKAVKKKVGINVVIDSSIDANDIATNWFGFDENKLDNINATAIRKGNPTLLSEDVVYDLKKSPVLFNTDALTKEVEGWNINSEVEHRDCNAKKAFAIAFYLTNNKETGKFVKRHFKEICFVDKIVYNPILMYSVINIDNFKIAVDGKVLKIEKKIFNPDDELLRECVKIATYLKENVGIRASIRKKLRGKKEK